MPKMSDVFEVGEEPVSKDDAESRFPGSTDDLEGPHEYVLWVGKDGQLRSSSGRSSDARWDQSKRRWVEDES